MRISVWSLRTPTNNILLSNEALPGYHEYWVEWTIPTVAQWKTVENEPERDLGCWKHLARHNLGDIPSFYPASVPIRLLRPLWSKVFLSKEEERHIDSNCMMLWGKGGGTVKNPHPLVEEIVSSMIVRETFGPALASQISDLPYKTYQAMRLISQLHGQYMAANDFANSKMK